MRLADFKITTQKYFSVLALQVRAADGEEIMEIIFPSGFENHVAKAMESPLQNGVRESPLSLAVG